MLRSLFVLLCTCLAFYSYGWGQGGIKARQAPETEIVLPEVDLQEIRIQDSLEELAGIPMRFGIPHTVDIDLMESGAFQQKEDAREYSVAFRCPGALSVHFLFESFLLPAGASLEMLDEDGRLVLGPFTHAENHPSQQFATLPIPGEWVRLKYSEPKDAAFQGKIFISKVIHDYRDILKIASDFNDSESCNVNVNCPVGAPWSNDKKAVALIMVSGFRFCTGTLLNNVLQDGKPYFLTAHHCLDNSLGLWTFVFNYESPSCNNVNGSLNQSVTGAMLRSHLPASDFALLELWRAPDPAWGIYFAGWDRQNTVADSCTIIHHPSGDIKKITQDYGSVVSASGDLNVANSHWRTQNYELGTTEGGSSGCPIFNIHHQVIGQLWGGDASCTVNTWDEYGKVAHSWATQSSYAHRLQNWLDPNNTAALNVGGSYYQNPDSLDNSMLKVESPDVWACDSLLQAKVWLRNLGENLLHTFDVGYILDGGAPVIESPLVSVSYYGNYLHSFPPISISAGAHQIKYFCSGPNSGTDQDLSNDTLIYSFVQNNGMRLTIDVVSDRYGDEISWKLKQSNGQLVDEKANLENSTSNVAHYCLVPGDCYDFVIKDEGGNGICCQNGQGSYSISNTFGNLVSGSSFGARDSVRFCLNTALPIAAIQVSGTSVCKSSSLLFTSQSQNGPSTLAWTFGSSNPATSTQASQNVIFLVAGTYWVKLIATNANGSDTDSVRITVYPKPAVNISTVPNTQVFPNNGGAVANVSAGTPPFAYSWSNGGSTDSISGLAPGVYVVSVTDSNGCMGQASGSVANIVAIEKEIVKSPAFVLYPNPAKEGFWIKPNDIPTGEYLMEILNIEGKRMQYARIYLQHKRPSYFETETLPSGLYYLHIRDLGSMYSQPFSVQR